MIPAIILARGGSKRIPRKNVIEFCGKPLIAWSIEHATFSKKVDATYVSTEDDEIAKIAEEYGAKVIRRPKKFAEDFSSSEDALKHAISEIGKTDKIEYVVFLQPTSPLREKYDIDGAIDTIKAQDADSLFSGAEIGDFLIWGINEHGIKSINYDYKHRKRSQEFDKQFVENGSIYVFKPDILNQNNRLGGKIAIYKMKFWQTFEIDNFEDIKLCKILFENYLNKNKV